MERFFFDHIIYLQNSNKSFKKFNSADTSKQLYSSNHFDLFEKIYTYINT